MLLYRTQVGQAFLPALQRTGLEACPYLSRTRYTNRRIALIAAHLIAVIPRSPGTLGRRGICASIFLAPRNALQSAFPYEVPRRIE